MASTNYFRPSIHARNDVTDSVSIINATSSQHIPSQHHAQPDVTESLYDITNLTGYSTEATSDVPGYSTSPPSNLTEYTTAILNELSGTGYTTENINDINTTSDNDYYYDYYYDEDLIEAHDRRIYTRFYMLSVILPAGIFFNTFAFIVFMRSPNINRTTTGRFLIALTIADTLFLIGDFLRWLNSADTKGQILGIEFAEEYLVWCALIYSMRYYGQLVSSWLTVAITIERFIGVAFPLRASRISTMTKTNVVISITWILSIGLTCFPFWTLRINSMDGLKWCEYKDQKEFDRWSWAIIRILSLILPSIIIFVFTGLIIYKLNKITRNRAEMTRMTGRGKKQTLEKQLTFMLIAVAVTFLILRLPYVITYYLFDFRYDFWGEEIDPWFEYRLWLAKDICDVFATTNYAVNFFLYCMTGSQFRSNIISCMRCESVRAIRLKKYQSTFRSNTVLTTPGSSSSSNSSLNTVTNGKTNGVTVQPNGKANGVKFHANGISQRKSMSIV